MLESNKEEEEGSGIKLQPKSVEGRRWRGGSAAQAAVSPGADSAIFLFPGGRIHPVCVKRLLKNMRYRVDTASERGGKHLRGFWAFALKFRAVTVFYVPHLLDSGVEIRSKSPPAHDSAILLSPAAPEVCFHLRV